MLNGVDPVILFQLYKLVPAAQSTLSKIPIASDKKTLVTFAVVPIYLSEQITGLYIDNESKQIDIDTNTNSLPQSGELDVSQKALSSITTVQLKARAGSVGLTILLAMAELLLDKVTSQEYEITYMHGAVTVFGGLIHSLSYEQGENDDLIKIKLELARGRQKKKSINVEDDPNAVRLGTTGTTPAEGASKFKSTTTSSPSQITPGVRMGGLP